MAGLRGFAAAMSVVLLLAADLSAQVPAPNEPLQQEDSSVETARRNNASRSASDRAGRDLARRLAAGSPDAMSARAEVKSLAQRLSSPEARDAEAASWALRGVIAGIVDAPRLYSGSDAVGPSGMSMLRAVFELIAEVSEGPREVQSARFWNGLSTVAEPLGEGGVVRRIRHVEVLARALTPPFDWLENRLVSWNLVRRETASLKVDLSAVDQISPNGSSRIQVTVISAPSGEVSFEEVSNLIEDVTEWDPERRLVVLADGVNYERLDACCSSERVAIRPSFGQGFSAWPRDAMTFARTRDGSPILLLRPNENRGREFDALMARSLLQFGDLEGAAGQPVRWLSSPVPFHNGQILFTPGETWVSLHSLERRALEILDLPEIPVESFSSPSGLETYIGALRQAAGEYEVLFSQAVDLVHPLPSTGSPQEREAAMWRLAGGAGWDLDSLVTILPRVGDLPVTLVGSPVLGSAMLSTLPDGELERWLDSLGLQVEPSAARAALTGPFPRRSSLQQFLDVVASHLGGAGHEVVRVPMFVLPSGLSPALPTDVLVGMHNVVLERGVRGPRAEGFRSGLDRLDLEAQAVFRRAGYELRLMQPILHSVLRNAGYRCSSNHLRSTEAVGPGELRHLTSGRSVDLTTLRLADDD